MFGISEQSSRTAGFDMSEGFEMPLTPAERVLRSQFSAHESWARTVDRTARTANARKAFHAKFLAEADGDPKRAESLRKAHFARMAFKSAKARRRRSGGDAA